MQAGAWAATGNPIRAAGVNITDALQSNASPSSPREGPN